MDPNIDTIMETVMDNLKERHIIFKYRAGNQTRLISGIVKSLHNDYFSLGRKGYFFSNVEGPIYNYYTNKIVDMQNLNII